jgi:hypothetical protein
MQRLFAAHAVKRAPPTLPDVHCRSLHSLTTSSLTSVDLVCRRLPAKQTPVFVERHLETRPHSWGPEHIADL